MSNGSNKKKNGAISIVIKSALGVVTVAGIIFAVLKMDDYVEATSKQQAEIITTNLETTVVQTLKEFQGEIDKRQQQQDLRFYDFLTDSYSRDYDRCQKELRNEPQNPELKDECENYKEKRRRIQQKRDQLIY